MRAKIVYTDDFRRKVVQEVVDGKWTGYTHAQRVYGIKGTMTVRKPKKSSWNLKNDAMCCHAMCCEKQAVHQMG